MNKLAKVICSIALFFAVLISVNNNVNADSFAETFVGVGFDGYDYVPPDPSTPNKPGTDGGNGEKPVDPDIEIDGDNSNNLPNIEIDGDNSFSEPSLPNYNRPVTNHENNFLPQTGEKRNNTSILGLIVLLISSYVLWKERRLIC